MRYIKFFTLLFALVQVVYGQHKDFSRGEDSKFNNQVMYSYWINPVQFDENLIFNYHIRYDFLLFEKTPPDKPFADTFQAKVKVMIELSSLELLTPIRNVEEVTIKTTDFQQTISKNLYYSSNFSLKIPAKKYKITFTILDEIRNKEFSLKPFDVDLKDTSNFELLFIRESDLGIISSPEMKNKFYNFLPFSSEKFLLILPEGNDFREVKIHNRFVNYKLSRKENTGLRFSIFSLDTLDLIEGIYQLRWGNERSQPKSFEVRWIDKPEYLNNFEKAINIMSYLFENENPLSKYHFDKDELRKKFFEMWKKFDPTPSTPFNELMAEFYRRADYSLLEFKSVSQPDGALTDRGKIYILYGHPTKIERSFAKDGRPVEVWTYNVNRQIKFTFFDENKNGNYILQK